MARRGWREGRRAMPHQRGCGCGGPRRPRAAGWQHQGVWVRSSAPPRRSWCRGRPATVPSPPRPCRSGRPECARPVAGGETAHLGPLFREGRIAERHHLAQPQRVAGVLQHRRYPEVAPPGNIDADIGRATTCASGIAPWNGRRAARRSSTGFAALIPSGCETPAHRGPRRGSAPRPHHGRPCRDRQPTRRSRR